MIGLLLSVAVAMGVGVPPKDTIVLTETNSVVLRGAVTDESMDRLKMELIKKTNSLFPPKEIYLVLDTPGGSVQAGNSFIDFAKSLNIKVHTVTLFAASMGFHMVQSLDDRLVMQSSTLMSHRASLQLAGELGGEFDSRLNWIRRTIQQMDMEVSKRVRMKYEDYQNIIRDELWLNGQDSITYRMADRVVKLQCGKSLLGNYTESVNVLFFTLAVTWSKCPLISAPLGMNIKNNAKVTPEKEKEFRSMINKLYYNKREFTTDYIRDVNGNKKFKEVFKIGQ